MPTIPSIPARRAPTGRTSVERPISPCRKCTDAKLHPWTSTGVTMPRHTASATLVLRPTAAGPSHDVDRHRGATCARACSEDKLPVGEVDGHRPKAGERVRAEQARKPHAWESAGDQKPLGEDGHRGQRLAAVTPTREGDGLCGDVTPDGREFTRGTVITQPQFPRGSRRREACSPRPYRRRSSTRRPRGSALRTPSQGRASAPRSEGRRERALRKCVWRRCGRRFQAAG